MRVILADAGWEALWQAVSEVNLPLHFHTFPSVSPAARDKERPSARRAAFFTRVSGFQLNLVNILAAIIGAKLIDDLGVETLIWGSDYPHTDGVWPESSKYISEQFSHVPAEFVRKITCDNAGKFYGLMT